MTMNSTRGSASLLWTAAMLLMLAGCTAPGVHGPVRRPAEVRAEIVRLIPASVADRQGWATDIEAAFSAQKFDANNSNLCAVLAVAEQESGFQVDPVVAGLPKIAHDEIFRRSEAMHVPDFVVNAALGVSSSNGRTYEERIAHVRTEKDMSYIFEDFIGMVPLGQRLFGQLNPVRTIGPMQVGIAFAEANAKDYPYPIRDSIRHELFTRRGGVYFGTLHLLGYPANYAEPLYRFADYNAGRYASRNAAFQSAVSGASGIAFAHDGSLLKPDAAFDEPGATERALRSLDKLLNIDDRAIREGLAQGRSAEFERSDLYQHVFLLADRIQHQHMPRALLPAITLEGPKISRNLTTAWYAQRVDQRYKRCVRQAAGN
ncbi:MAG TPA: DUF1615 domain-containing protein [Rudaea sp.]